MKFLLVFTVCSIVNGNCLEVMNTGKKFNTFRECTIAGYDFIAKENKLFSIDQFDKIKPSFHFDCIETSEQSINYNL
jgi:hypothetical protein